MKFFRFLSLLDSEGNLSITNIACVVGITKMALSSQMGGADVVALLAVFGNYGHKRAINSNATHE